MNERHTWVIGAILGLLAAIVATGWFLLAGLGLLAFGLWLFHRALRTLGVFSSLAWGSAWGFGLSWIILSLAHSWAVWMPWVVLIVGGLGASRALRRHDG